MKVKCIATLRKDLHQKAQDVLVTRDFELPIGKVFIIYGMVIWKDVLHYLIVEDENDEASPFWFPAELFVLEDTLLPKEMHYKYFGLQDRRGVNALWSYKEMVLDDSHYVDLLERKLEAAEIFLKRKKEIDEMYSDMKDEPH